VRLLCCTGCHSQSHAASAHFTILQWGLSGAILEASVSFLAAIHLHLLLAHISSPISGLHALASSMHVHVKSTPPTCPCAQLCSKGPCKRRCPHSASLRRAVLACCAGQLCVNGEASTESNHRQVQTYTGLTAATRHWRRAHAHIQHDQLERALVIHHHTCQGMHDCHCPRLALSLSLQ
jgi:hypothetical protein